MKKCGSCGEVKPFEDFYKNASKKDGYQSSCKQCKSGYNAKHYQKNRENYITRAKKYKEDNKDKILADRYNTTEKVISDLFEKKDSCEICGTITNLVVDHCHADGKIRGLLCSKCNVALGFLGDTTDDILLRLSQVQQYIQDK